MDLQLGDAEADRIRWACCVAYAWRKGGRGAEMLQVSCLDIAKLPSCSNELLGGCNEELMSPLKLA